jgi:hypothetical protein
VFPGSAAIQAFAGFRQNKRFAPTECFGKRFTGPSEKTKDVFDPSTQVAELAVFCLFLPHYPHAADERLSSPAELNTHHDTGCHTVYDGLVTLSCCQDSPAH